jgi:hypothetical protein
MLRTSTITAHPDSLIVSSVVLTENGQPYTRYNSNIKLHKVRNVSKLSIQSVRKVKKAIAYMAHLAPEKKIYNPKYCSKFNFKLSFITLTLASRQQHADQEIKGIVLHKFLDFIQKVHKVKNYVWKAERQKNGNVHFHLVIDKYISYEVIREKWNEYQDCLGYISRYYHNEDNNKPIPDTMKEYYAVNSTDVHSVRKIKDLKRYLIKYMIKPNMHNRMKVNKINSPLANNTHSDSIQLSDNTKKFLKNMASVGRLWGCSHSLSNISGARDFLSRDLEQEVELLKNDKGVYVKNEMYFLYLGFDHDLLKKLRCTAILDFLNAYLFEKFGYSSMSVI